MGETPVARAPSTPFRCVSSGPSSHATPVEGEVAPVHLDASRLAHRIHAPSKAGPIMRGSHAPPWLGPFMMPPLKAGAIRA